MRLIRRARACPRPAPSPYEWLVVWTGPDPVALGDLVYRLLDAGAVRVITGRNYVRGKALPAQLDGLEAWLREHRPAWETARVPDGQLGRILGSDR